MRTLLLFSLILLASPLPANPAPTILVLGDSLSAAYGMDLEQGWVELLGVRLGQQGYPYRVVNSSISGDTTSSALVRLERELDRHRPAIVLVALGGNDGLRSLPLESVSSNLSQIIERALASGADVALAAMRLPPNYGPLYVDAFEALFGALARRHAVTLIPFLLDGVATVPGMMQDDGVHPAAEAQPLILDNVWPYLEPVLQRRAQAPRTNTSLSGR